MADFEKAVNRTLDIEGGYVDDPHDYGGETKFGISKRSYPDIDIAALTMKGAKAIYKRDYWDKLLLDTIGDQVIAEELFDTAVNMGWRTAAKFLQLSINALGGVLKVDGIIGPKTAAAVNSYPHPMSLFKALNAYQGKRYIEIIERDESQERFFRGWLERI
jgi:lysozyme family protein